MTGADRRAVRDERGIVRVGHRGQAEQPGMVAEAHQQIRFRQGLIRASADAADPDQRFGALRVRAIHFFGRDRQDRLEQADRGIADRELGRVHADREAAAAGCGVVAGQRPLASLVEAAVRRAGPADARE